MLRINDTTHQITFRLTDSIDNRTGLDVDPSTISVQVGSPNEASLSTGQGSVQKIGNGWYGYLPTRSEVSKSGWGILQTDHPEAAVPSLVAYAVGLPTPSNRGAIGNAGWHS